MAKKIISKIIIIVLSILSIIFVYNDDFLYKNEIVKITKIENKKEEELTNQIGIREKHTIKKITGIVTNTSKKGEKRVVEYEETYSSVVTDKYKVNDKVFISNKSIQGLKRDTYVCIMTLLLILSLYLVGKVKGLLSIISVIVNSIVFYIGLLLYFKGVNLLSLCILESIIFSIISIFIAGGINKKTSSAILSTISTSLFVLIIISIVIKTTNYSGINFNELSFLTVPVENIIIPELFIGILGACMDVSITISSSIAELIEKNPKISTKSLTKSSKEIGKDIMTTMSNVLFFTYICAGLPIFILALRNGFSFSNYISTNFSLEISRFLVGSIGIILAIPVSTFISIRLFKRGAK